MAHHVHRDAGLGASVMITAGWYYLGGPPDRASFIPAHGDFVGIRPIRREGTVWKTLRAVMRINAVQTAANSNFHLLIEWFAVRFYTLIQRSSGNPKCSRSLEPKSKPYYRRLNSTIRVPTGYLANLFPAVPIRFSACAPPQALPADRVAAAVNRVVAERTIDR